MRYKGWTRTRAQKRDEDPSPEIRILLNKHAPRAFEAAISNSHFILKAGGAGKDLDRSRGRADMCISNLTSCRGKRDGGAGVGSSPGRGWDPGKRVWLRVCSEKR